MVRSLLIIILWISTLNASSFEENCLTCHSNDFKFKMMMKKYTLRYSSENRIKESLFEYLKHPTKETSVLPLGYITRFGLKKKTSLDDETLRNMVDIYYEEFNIKSKIY